MLNAAFFAVTKCLLPSCEKYRSARKQYGATARISQRHDMFCSLTVICRSTICKGSFKEVPCPHFCPPGMRSFLFPVEGGITGISADSNLAHNASRFTFTATSPLQPDRTLAARLSHLGQPAELRLPLSFATPDPLDVPSTKSTCSAHLHTKLPGLHCIMKCGCHYSSSQGETTQSERLECQISCVLFLTSTETVH